MKYACVSFIFLAMTQLNAQVTTQDRQLEEELLQLKKQARGTPAEFMGNRVSAAHIQLDRFALCRKQRGHDEKLRQRLTRLRDDIRRGLKWPEPGEATIPFTAKPPHLDGKWTPGEWNRALSYHGEYPVDSTVPSDRRTEWRIMYDRNCLYWSCRFTDNSPAIDKARPYDGDALELFVRADRRLREYRELVIDINGTHYAAWNVTKLYGTYDNYRGSCGKLRSEVGRDGEVFCIEAAVPWSEIPGYQPGTNARPGGDLCFMPVRVNRNKDGNTSSSTPVPLLYGGHNIYGHINGILEKRESKGTK